MKLLVTGGLGFIGSNFIRYILANDSYTKVFNVDNMSYGSNPNNLNDMRADSRYKFVNADICDQESINQLVKDVDAIVNFAAETHVDRSIYDASAFIKSNTLGTFTLLECMKKFNNNARFIHVSTDEVYGDLIKGSFDETDMLKPSNPYSASKAASDLFVNAYHRTYGLDCVITRCTNNFGPMQFPEKLIPKTIIRSMLDMKVPVYGKGINVRDWIYVEDHCSALELIMRKGRPGEIYNISAGNEMSNLEIVKTILRMMNKPEDLIALVEDRPGHDIRYSLDSSKLRKELGWVQKFRFQDALSITVKWYIQNNWWWRPIANEEVLSLTPWKRYR